MATSSVCNLRTTDRPTVNIMQACEIAGVSRRTIYNWMHANKIQYRRTAGGAVRIYEDSLWKPEPESTNAR